MGDLQCLDVVMCKACGTREDINGGGGQKVVNCSWMDCRRVALDVEASVPDMVYFSSIRYELERSVDLNGGAVVDSGHSAAIHDGGGGEEVEIKGAREERGALELNSGV